MIKRMGIREIARNLKLLDKFDYIEVEDKKTHKIKGIFISGKYLDEIKEIVRKIIEEKKKKEVEEILKFVGIAEGDTKNMSEKELREYHAKKYSNK